MPPYLIINWMVPDYPPSGMLAAKRTDGPGWHLVIYCRLSDAVRSMLRDGTSSQMPSIELARRYMSPSEGVALRGERLKCIFGAAGKQSLAPFGAVLKQMLTRYNFRPFLSRTASLCYTGASPSGQPYFEIDIDIHSWGNTALSAFGTVKHRIGQMAIRGGLVLEAVDDGEMPEQILGGCIYLLRIDPQRATAFPADLAQYLSATQTEPLLRGVYKCGKGDSGDGVVSSDRETSVTPPSLSPPCLSPRDQAEEGAAQMPSLHLAVDEPPPTMRH